MSDTEATQPLSNVPPQLGRYRIVRELGRGAMGIVYEGLDPNIGRRVAIKTARRDMLQAESNADELMERFLREARAAGGLNHPNIVTVYDADEQDGVAYIAMEYLEGEELRAVMDQGPKLEIAELVRIAATLCEALAHAHSRGVVHRDVKPSNVMLLGDGTIKVADFGVAHLSDSNLTRDGAVIGTPCYMSPEQFMGHAVDGRSDLFAAGVILYELVTGEKPFLGQSVSAVMHNVLHSAPIPPTELNFSVSEALNAIILQSLAKSPEHRYPTGEVMAAALRAALDAPRETLSEDGMATEETIITGEGLADTEATLPVAGQDSAPSDVSTHDAARPIDSPRRIHTRRRPMLLAGGGATLGVLLLAFGSMLWPRSASDVPIDTAPFWGTIAFEVVDTHGNPITTPERFQLLDDDTGVVAWEGALSPDAPRITLPPDSQVREFIVIHVDSGNRYYSRFQPETPGEAYPGVMPLTVP